MLASQFLNVVLEDKSESESEDEDKNNNLMRTLQLKTKLPKVFIEECTIELNVPGEKKPPKELSFEAYVSPIYTTAPYTNNDNGIIESGSDAPNCYQIVRQQFQNFNQLQLEDLDQESLVEAVYSDEESSDGGSGEYDNNTQCKHCGLEFYRSSSLAIHLRSHDCLGAATLVQPQDYRPFKCEQCGKSYAQKSVLKKHMAVHSGEKLQCNLCSVGFTQRSSLVRHRKRLHPELFEENNPA